MNYNNYGKAALKTLKVYKNYPTLRLAWVASISELTTSQSAVEKSCPRSTFLGLCEEGLVKGIPAGVYESNSTINKNHAIEAVNYLMNNRINSISQKELWSKLDVDSKSHNSQMDVVLALWHNNLIQ